MENARAEFWGDLQVDFVTANTAVYLANTRLENLISQDGRKAHRPIMSGTSAGTYTAHTEITYEAKTAEDSYLEVDTSIYGAHEIDDTEKAQSPYELVSLASSGIRAQLNNQVEQKYLSKITDASHSYNSGTATIVESTNILDIIEEADGKLGAYDIPVETGMKAAVFGPRTIAKLRRAKADRESRLGDAVMENGVVGPFQGWTVVQSNNLPWSATLTIATQPTDGDTVTVAGVTFTFKTTLGSTAGNVLIGADAAAARANLRSAVLGLSGAGSTYVAVKNTYRKILQRRSISCTSAQDMAWTGYGDIAVAETLTAAADVWSAQRQSSIFMVRGAIDLVLQLQTLETLRSTKIIGDLVRGMIMVGAKAFEDGAMQMVKVTQDVSNFK